MKLLGFDPSLNNWGVAQALLTTNTTIEVTGLDLISPVKPSGKQVRQNSKDIQCAAQLATAITKFCPIAQAIFVEVPVGSQSSRAMASYGICVGILGAIREQGYSFFELTPKEVKLAATGDPNASKQTMIDWAISAFPDAGWPRHQGKVTASKAEHMADAVATIYAGIQLSEFQTLLKMRA